MSIHFDASRDRFVVRWKQDGRRRVRRFRSEADAIAFDASLLSPARRPRLPPTRRDRAYLDACAPDYRQQGRRGDASQPTKGKRFRSVQIGPTLAGVLAKLREDRRAGPDDWLFLCPPPRRGRYAGRTEPTPPNRRTVHDWHEAALVDAGHRDMPLHALRHTAAAAWLATGHPLIFVQRQLGHPIDHHDRGALRAP